MDVASVQVRGGLDGGELVRHHDAAALVVTRKRRCAVDEEASFRDLVGEAPHPEHAVDFLEGGGLERDDGRDVAHHARVAEHALDAGLGEALEDGVQHLHAR